MKVAVYGTLRRGYGNHRLLQKATYHGEHRLEGFQMYKAFGTIPGIKRGEGSVVVESYSDYDIKALDTLEGEGSLYNREVVEVNGEPHYIYTYPHEVEQLIPSGDYNKSY